MSTTIYLKIDGVQMPTPSQGITYTRSNLQNSGYRDTLGVLHKTTVRFGVRKAEVPWDELNNADLQTIYNAINGKEWFTVTIYEPLTGSESTYTGYNGDLTYKLQEITKNGSDSIVTDVKLSYIEQ